MSSAASLPQTSAFIASIIGILACTADRAPSEHRSPRVRTPHELRAESLRAATTAWLTTLRITEPTIVALLPYHAAVLALDTTRLPSRWEQARAQLRIVADSLGWPYQERSAYVAQRNFPVVDDVYNHLYRLDMPVDSGGYLLAAPGLVPTVVEGPYRSDRFVTTILPFLRALEARDQAVSMTSPGISGSPLLSNKAAAAAGRDRSKGSRWVVRMADLVTRSLTTSAAGAGSPAAEPQSR